MTFAFYFGTNPRWLLLRFVPMQFSLRRRRPEPPVDPPEPQAVYRPSRRWFLATPRACGGRRGGGCLGYASIARRGSCG